ncbi:hypothetical protein, partial [Burkholderia cepacia]|uniref:hypothetical protein n=1 Tax=Burkholderia cepacia TaxID=292 RepID=UPI002FE06BCA
RRGFLHWRDGNARVIGICGLAATGRNLRLEKGHVIHPLYLARRPDHSAAILQSNPAPKRNHAI